MSLRVPSPPTVIKFGGSLLRHPELDRLLATAARHGAIVAPGGGRFADAVRDAQQELGFGGDDAHRMAILAMEQAACVLAGRAPQLASCGSPEDFASAAGSGMLWRPAPMAFGAAVPASWEVTSDSLALWLAIELGAPRLVLLKSAAVDPASGVGDWIRTGVVDFYFPELARSFGGTILCLGPVAPHALEAVLAKPARLAA